MTNITFDNFVNQTDHKFKDISTERYRTYVFPCSTGAVNINIDEPVALNVSRSGGHRVIDASGTSHYIPKGWIHLHWDVKEGEANFVA